MSKPPFSVLKRVVHELILPFYAIERATPLPKHIGRQENDAEHSWGLALLACALAPQIDAKLDIGKISQFAVVHDLLEVYAGDTSNFGPDSEKATKEAREHEAFVKLKTDFKELPWIIETVAVYESQESPEAKFVRSLDKTLSLLQEYESEGQILQNFKITEEKFKTKLEQHKRKAMVYPEVFEYYEAAERSLLDNPHFFYKEK